MYSLRLQIEWWFSITWLLLKSRRENTQQFQKTKHSPVSTQNPKPHVNVCWWLLIKKVYSSSCPLQVFIHSEISQVAHPQRLASTCRHSMQTQRGTAASQLQVGLGLQMIPLYFHCCDTALTLLCSSIHKALKPVTGIPVSMTKCSCFLVTSFLWLVLWLGSQKEPSFTTMAVQHYNVLRLCTIPCNMALCWSINCAFMKNLEREHERSEQRSEWILEPTCPCKEFIPRWGMIKRRVMIH